MRGVYFKPIQDRTTSTIVREKATKDTDKDIRENIKDFFLNNPRPSDKQVHSLAKQLGIDKHRFEEIIYAMLSDSLRGI
jgi:hypothetical protein